MRATRVMTKNVKCVEPDSTLERAWGLMQALRVRHLPVVFEGRLVGILSDRDLLRRALPVDGDALKFPPTTVGGAMTPRPITCPPTTSVARLAALMLEHRVASIPIVTTRDVLVGLVTSSDLLELLTAPDTFGDELPFAFTVETVSGRDAA